MKLGHLRGSNIAWPFFLYKLLILLKSPFLAFFGPFWPVLALFDIFYYCCHFFTILSNFWYFAIFCHFLLNFSRTEICTAKPMVVGCVQHSTHFIKKLGKSLQPFFNKVKKKLPKKGDFSKISNLYKKKRPCYVRALRWPNFMPNFRKILRVFFE